MRRSASEVIRNLESRIARLENSTPRRKSASETAKLSNGRAIVMVEDRQYKDDTINIGVMHLDPMILRNSVSHIMSELAHRKKTTPHSLDIIEEHFVSEECKGYICITVKLVDSAFWGVGDKDLSEIARDWIDENIIKQDNSIPAK